VSREEEAAMVINRVAIGIRVMVEAEVKGGIG